MGYYVPNKMPEDCRECPYNHYVEMTGETVCDAGQFVMQTDSQSLPFEGRHPDCPLIDVPDGHGDLIDKQYVYQNTMTMGEHMRKIVLKQIDLLPTIIPADHFRDVTKKVATDIDVGHKEET